MNVPASLLGSRTGTIFPLFPSSTHCELVLTKVRPPIVPDSMGFRCHEIGDALGGLGKVRDLVLCGAGV